MGAINGRERLLAVADRVQRAQLWVAVVALVVLMLVTVFDVFLRYLFNRPIRGSYDMVETMLLVFVFNGMAASFFGRRHIVIDLLDALVGARATALLIRLADVLAVVCLGLLAWAMLLPAGQAYAYGDVKLELGLPIYVLWFIALISLVGTMFCALATLVAKPATADSGHSE
ncbi:MAG TPA: TRAP transporter small permease [Xanthobacteraceae bacterium]|jgi:TRAP-type C4-dicarboxylate transport system permease small subunit